MSLPLPATAAQVTIPKSALQKIFDALLAADFLVVGPTVREGAIIYDEIEKIEQLPIGWTDEQRPGAYRLKPRADQRYFGFVVGPQSWKKYLFPANLKLFSTRKAGASFEVQANDEPPPKYAFIGVRGCELAAIAVQDRTFLEGAIQEPHYKARREKAFILAVNCTEPGGTCFCVSMKTGPKCGSGFDLALTELNDAFLVEVGSPLGAEMLAETGWRPAGAFELNHAARALAEAETNMGRTLDTRDLPNLLYENLEHPRWDQLAQRCLSCANCTMVCPTCFCSDVEDVADLTGANTERVRVWDSCFNPDFSSVYGGHLRPTIRSRYRQWLTHKLASWIDQFGTSGCVGCGRCITWCPVGIDLTEEVAAIRGESPA
ncbi:MAG: 4Fe-4S dicluster domain-containing protein [Anaerolineales bacterium]